MIFEPTSWPKTSFAMESCERTQKQSVTMQTEHPFSEVLGPNSFLGEADIYVDFIKCQVPSCSHLIFYHYSYFLRQDLAMYGIYYVNSPVSNSSRGLPASASEMLGLETCATAPGNLKDSFMCRSMSLHICVHTPYPCSAHRSRKKEIIPWNWT